MVDLGGCFGGFDRGYIQYKEEADRFRNMDIYKFLLDRGRLSSRDLCPVGFVSVLPGAFDLGCDCLEGRKVSRKGAEARSFAKGARMIMNAGSKKRYRIIYMVEGDDLILMNGMEAVLLKKLEKLVETKTSESLESALEKINPIVVEMHGDNVKGKIEIRLLN